MQPEITWIHSIHKNACISSFDGSLLFFPLTRNFSHHEAHPLHAGARTPAHYCFYFPALSHSLSWSEFHLHLSEGDAWLGFILGALLSSVSFLHWLLFYYPQMASPSGGSSHRLQASMETGDWLRARGVYTVGSLFF